MARKKMDRLSRENAQALAAGMSYGKWKAMQQPVKVEKKKVQEEYIENVCPWCGKKFIPQSKRKKTYCSATCQKVAYYENNKQILLEKMMEYRRAKANSN